MNLTDEKIINFSRSAMAWMVILGCTFVAAGYWMYQTDAYQLSKMRHPNSLATTHAFGLLTMILGIALTLIAIKVILDKKRGLILNSNGILTKPDFPAAQLIPWDEIVGLEVVEYRNDTKLVVKVKNPEKYIVVKGGVEDKLRRNESTKFGSPITISTTFLDIDVEGLETLCNSYLANYANSH